MNRPRLFIVSGAVFMWLLTLAVFVYHWCDEPKSLALPPDTTTVGAQTAALPLQEDLRTVALRLARQHRFAVIGALAAVAAVVTTIAVTCSVLLTKSALGPLDVMDGKIDAADAAASQIPTDPPTGQEKDDVEPTDGRELTVAILVLEGVAMVLGGCFASFCVFRKKLRFGRSSDDESVPESQGITVSWEGKEVGGGEKTTDAIVEIVYKDDTQNAVNNMRVGVPVTPGDNLAEAPVGSADETPTGGEGEGNSTDPLFEIKVQGTDVQSVQFLLEEVDPEDLPTPKDTNHPPLQEAESGVVNSAKSVNTITPPDPLPWRVQTGHDAAETWRVDEQKIENVPKCSPPPVPIRNGSPRVGGFRSLGSPLWQGKRGGLFPDTPPGSGKHNWHGPNVECTKNS